MSTSTRPAWANERQDLAGRRVLIVGGAGGVGEGVVRALLDTGADVVATSRSPERAQQFATLIGHDGLEVIALDTLSGTFTADVRALGARRGSFDAVVVAIASWGDQGQKPLLSLTDAEWGNLIAANQTAVFRAYRELFPLLSPAGVLIQLNGLSADIPFPGAGGVALSSAATKSLTRTLAVEVEGQGPRVYEVVLGYIRTRPRQIAGVDNPGWIDGTEVGTHVAELVAGTSPLSGTTLHYFVDKGAGPQTSPPPL